MQLTTKDGIRKDMWKAAKPYFAKYILTILVVVYRTATKYTTTTTSSWKTSSYCHKVHNHNNKQLKNQF